MIKLFKRKTVSSPFFRSIPLCTVKIVTEEDFKSFATFCASNFIYINYALSDISDWQRVESKKDCFAIINYAPNAGCNHKIRVDFHIWNPYTSKMLGEKFEETHRNYKSSEEFCKQFTPDMLYWLLDEKYGK
jgi:hypothetical protein